MTDSLSVQPVAPDTVLDYGGWPPSHIGAWSALVVGIAALAVLWRLLFGRRG